MAVARPIRMLGAACIVLVLFMIFQLNKEPELSKGDNVGGLKSDPLLAREYRLDSYCLR